MAVPAMHEKEKPPDIFWNLRLFERHFVKTRKAWRRLPDRRIALSITAKRDEETVVQFKAPDTSDFVAFITLMRDLVLADRPFSCAQILSILRTAFRHRVEWSQIEQVEQCLRHEAEFSFKLNGATLSSARIYELLGDGCYFIDESQVSENLKNLLNSVGPFLWYRFYSYNAQVFLAAELLYRIVTSVVKQTREYEWLRANWEGALQKCIFCLTEKGSFAEEHVYPVALTGENGVVLPKGCVCRKCNNQEIGTLDKYVASFLCPVHTFFGPLGRKGKMPISHVKGGVIERTLPRLLTFRSTNGESMIREKEKLPDGRVKLGGTFTLKEKFDARKLGRAICKIALGMLAYKNGRQAVLHRRFDPVRNFIRWDRDFCNYLVMRSVAAPPEPAVRTRIITTNPGTVVLVSIYGLLFGVNLEPQPVLQFDGMMRELGFQRHPLFSFT